MFTVLKGYTHFSQIYPFRVHTYIGIVQVQVVQLLHHLKNGNWHEMLWCNYCTTSGSWDMNTTKEWHDLGHQSCRQYTSTKHTWCYHAGAICIVPTCIITFFTNTSWLIMWCFISFVLWYHIPYKTRVSRIIWTPHRSDTILDINNTIRTTTQNMQEFVF